MSETTIEHPSAEQCEQCGRVADELCADGYCRDCHVSLSFEDCVSGEWVRRVRRSAGLQP